MVTTLVLLLVLKANMQREMETFAQPYIAIGVLFGVTLFDHMTLTYQIGYKACQNFISPRQLCSVAEGLDNREVDLPKLVELDQFSIVALVEAKTALNQVVTGIGNQVHPCDRPHYREDCQRQRNNV